MYGCDIVREKSKQRISKRERKMKKSVLSPRAKYKKLRPTASVTDIGGGIIKLEKSRYISIAPPAMGKIARQIWLAGISWII